MKKQKGVYEFTSEALGKLSAPKSAPAEKEGKKPKPGRKKQRFPSPSLFRPGTRIEVEGFNQAKLLNELRSSGGAYSGVDRVSPSKMRFTAPEKDLAKTFAILEKLCYNYTVLEKVSPKSFLSFLLKKAALIAAVLLFAAVSFYAYGFVWQVEVTGCEKTESAAIERFLSENGYGPGARKSKLDPVKIRSLVNSLDDVLETSVSLWGVTLKIEVTETIDHLVPEPPATNGIYSRYDATVTRIVAEGGTPLVNPGARVFKGAALIGSYRADKDGNLLPVPAAGKVYGAVTFTDSYDFCLTETRRERTGKKSKKTDYSFFGLDWNGKEKHGFALYESETENAYVFENCFIPLKIRQTVYYELTEAETVYDLDERTQYYQSKALAAHAVEIGSGEFTVKTKLEQTGENTYRLHVFTQAELLIGEN